MLLMGASLREPHINVLNASGVCLYVPYSGKFSRGPIFVEGQSSEISWSNFCGWPRGIAVPELLRPQYLLTLPFTACMCWLKPAEKACERSADCKQLYEAFIHPHLEHATAVWDPHLSKNKQELEYVRFACSVCTKTWNDAYCNILRTLNIPPLSERNY